ncbi:MAG: CHRD domain-containing protein [Polyangiales bacterium]
MSVACGGDGADTADDRDAGAHDAGAHDAGAHDTGVEDAGGGPFDHDAGVSPDASAYVDAGLPGTFYNVTLTPGAEAPPCASAAPAASGVAQVYVFEQSPPYLSVNLSYENLSSAPTGAHIHYAAAGATGPVVISLGSTLASPISGTFNASNYFAVTGAPATFAAFVSELEAGKAYLNLHTQSCPDGEIRGQIQ